MIYKLFHKCLITAFLLLYILTVIVVFKYIEYFGITRFLAHILGVYFHIPLTFLGLVFQKNPDFGIFLITKSVQFCTDDKKYVT